MPPKSRSKGNPWAAGAVGVKWTIAVEAANIINVGALLKGNNGVVAVRGYLSDSAAGAGLVATAPSGAVAIGTDGVLWDDGVAKKTFNLLSTSGGAIDINITEAGVKTLYVVLVMPDGSLAISPAVVFA